jgi:hypothetical protein
MGDWIFAFFHLFLLIGITGYAFYLLAQGNTFRFGLIVACLFAYYFLVLHKSVTKEIRRRREERKNREGTN